MDSLLIRNGRIATFGKENKVLEDHAIYIEGNYIKSIIPESQITDIYKYAEVVNANKKLIMPGLINPHMHLYSTFARGISLKNKPPRNFAEILDKLWWKLDKTLSEEDIYYSALIPLIECVKAGTTTIIDHHASPYNIKNSLETIAKAYNTVGLRGVLAYEVSNRDGDEIAHLGIEENIKFIEKHKNDTMIKGLFGLHAMFTLSDNTLNIVSEEIERLKTGVHIHVAEDKYDKDFNIAIYGLSPIERLNKFKLTRPESIFAHCIHIDHNDTEILKNTDTMVVHNPQSNMNNAVGCCNIFRLLENNITTGLGTDGMTWNIMEELGVANLIHKHVNQSGSVGWCEIEKLVTQNNPTIASRIFTQKIGEISPEALADIIIVDYDPPTPINESNFWGHMLFGINKSKVLTTIVNGKILMENGNIAISGLNEAEINIKSRELAQKFWERF